jgi:hypothetical protein
VTSRGSISSTYTATCTLKTCVHGYLDSSIPSPIPATLIVLEYNLSNPSSNKYTEVFTAFEFSSGIGKKGTGGEEGPHVIAWAPKTAKAHVTTAEERKTKDRKFEELRLDVLGNGGKISAPLGNSTTEVGTRNYFQYISSDKSLSGKGGTGYNRVWWHMEENKREKDGVPPSITTAVLLERKDDEKFSGKFVLNLQATKLHKARNEWNRFWGIVEDDSVLFDPKLPKYGGEGIQEGYLGLYRVNDDLEDMGHFENPPVVD